MKNLFKISLFILLIFSSIFSFSFVNNINSSYALNTDNTHTVNFYSGNNLLYSVEIEDGQSLQDLENSNLLYNSDFTDCTIGNYTASTSSTYLGTNSYWSIYGNSSLTAEVNSYKFVLVNNSSTDTTYYLNYRGNNLLPYSGNQVTISCRYKYIDNDNYAYLWVESTPGSGITSRLSYTSEFVSFGGTLPSNLTRNGLTFSISSGCSIKLDYVKYELGNVSTDYFKPSYIDKLYREYNNITTNNSIYWSLSNQSIGKFDFSSPIKEDINLYGSTNLYYNVNFYSSDRLTLLSSYTMSYGSNLSSIYSDIKQLYFSNNSEFVNLDDFNLVFTDDYYSYNNYFNTNYIILEHKNLYCVAIPNDYDIVDSSNYSSFGNFDAGDNLLNQINIDSIKFNITEFYPLDDTPLYTLKFTRQNPNIILNTNIYSTFTDYYNNTYYYKIYGYIEDNLYLYDIYLYRVNMTDFEHFCFYPSPPDLFIIDNFYNNYISTYTSYDTEYYFKYNIDFNMNYYYADYFALTFSFTGGSKINNLMYYDTSNRLYNMNSIINNPVKGLNSSLMLNSYVNSFSFNVKARMQFLSLPVTDDFYYQLFEEVGGLEFYSPKVYYYQSNNQSNGNNIIPTDTNGLYKQKQNWWDFGTDIYNMFIYIIFEAPIISNITELVYVIIALIINTILTIVGLFNSVNNTIFIAMILGFLLFKFITKKFLGGSS